MTKRLNKLQADQWLQDHQVLINAPSCYLSERPYDGRTEVKGRSPSRMGRDQTQVKGRLFHPVSGDGWDNLTWRFQGKMRWSSKTGKWSVKSERPASFSKARGTTLVRSETEAPTTRERGRLAAGEKVKPDMSMRPTMERGYYPTPAFDFGLPCEPPGEWRDGYNAKRQALKEVNSGGLRPVTILLGQRLPFHLSIQKRQDYAKQTISQNRTCSIQELMVDDEEPLVFADDRPTNLELIGLDDLWSLLRSRLTAKEMEALDEKVTGVAQSDRSGQNLARARRKAEEALQT